MNPVNAVRKIVAYIPALPGIQTYVTGASPLIVDMRRSGETLVFEIAVASVVVILLCCYFSIVRSLASLLCRSWSQFN
ncbi:hypothetical protein DIJ64_01375 [Mycobacterium leprae]|uniref:Membrane transport protein MMPL domain-containing protein n=1 Tax=Mycobacterium leprae TaxID=1769 RepID=A0AAD0P4E2_MYCLR|nr:hypothetical protein DIJ64_01375 [Mycobacterium leprae]